MINLRPTVAGIGRPFFRSGRRLRVAWSPRDPTPALPSPPAVSARPPHAIIVGAGVAGLVAARLLVDRGFGVTILEARGRPGGRILTHRQGLPNGAYAELGAGRIADTHRWTMWYIRRLGLRLAPMYPSRGRLTALRNGRTEYGISCRLLASNHVHRLLLHEIPWEFQFHTRRPVLREWRAELLEPAWYRIIGGTDRLIDRLARPVQSHIRYYSPVVAIEQHGNRVQVRFREGEEEMQVEGDFCIVTVPLTVLRRLTLRPSPDPDLRHVIAQCPYQSAVRVVTPIKERSALRRNGANGYGIAEQYSEVWSPGGDDGSGRGIIIYYAQGSAAEPFLSLTPAERTERATGILRAMFPGVTTTGPQISHCWNDEPWSLGAQSRLPHMDGFERALELLARPHGRMILAGEHVCSPMSLGWIDGALESAHRAAALVCSAL